MTIKLVTLFETPGRVFEKCKGKPITVLHSGELDSNVQSLRLIRSL